MRLGAEHDPVGRPHHRGRIGKCGERQFGGAAWRFQSKPIEWLTCAGDHVVAARRGKAARHGAADAAEADNGDAPARFSVR